jgi:hypothetical protein
VSGTRVAVGGSAVAVGGALVRVGAAGLAQDDNSTIINSHNRL